MPLAAGKSAVEAVGRGCGGEPDELSSDDPQPAVATAAARTTRVVIRVRTRSTGGRVSARDWMLRHTT